MGAINAGWRIMVRFKQSGDNRCDHAIGAAISKVWVSIQSRKSSGICFGFMRGMNNICNAKDFRQNVQALNCQGDTVLPENPDSPNAAENFANGRICCGSEIDHGF
jgi:hypothetical protein